VLVGAEDQISKQEKIIEFFKKSNSDDIKLQIFQKGVHNLHMGVEKDRVKACMLKWINAQLNSAAPLGIVLREPNPRYKKRKTVGTIKIIIALLLYVKGLQLYVY
jgi:hypothetical protein